MQKEQKLETRHFGPLRSSKGHHCRGEPLCCSEGCLAAARPKGKKAPPASLRYNEVLRRAVDTVNMSHFRIFVSEHLVFVHQLFRNPIK